MLDITNLVSNGFSSGGCSRTPATSISEATTAKPRPALTRTGCFDRRVERQQVSLPRQIGDDVGQRLGIAPARLARLNRQPRVLDIPREFLCDLHGMVSAVSNALDRPEKFVCSLGDRAHLCD